MRYTRARERDCVCLSVSNVPPSWKIVVFGRMDLRKWDRVRWIVGSCAPLMTMKARFYSIPFAHCLLRFSMMIVFFCSLFQRRPLLFISFETGWKKNSSEHTDYEYIQIYRFLFHSLIKTTIIFRRCYFQMIMKCIFFTILDFFFYFRCFDAARIRASLCSVQLVWFASHKSRTVLIFILFSASAQSLMNSCVASEFRKSQSAAIHHFSVLSHRFPHENGAKWTNQIKPRLYRFETTKCWKTWAHTKYDAHSWNNRTI